MPGLEPRPNRGLGLNDQTLISGLATAGVEFPLQTWSTTGPTKAGTLTGWVSQNVSGCGKVIRVLLRCNGVLVASALPISMTVDSSAGHDQQFTIVVPASAFSGSRVYTLWLLSTCTGPIASDTRVILAVPAVPPRSPFGLPGRRPVVPGDIPDLACWLRGDSIRQAEGSPVSLWRDRSAGGHSLVQVTAANQPVYSAGAVNGLPGVCFYSVAAVQSLTWPTYWASAFTAGEVFAVVAIKQDPPADDNRAALWAMGGGGDNSFYRFSNANWYDDWGSTSRPAYGVPSPTSNYLNRGHILNIASASGAKTVWIDGVQFYTTGTNTVAFPSSGTFGIGISSSGRGMLGTFAELVVFNRTLLAAERAAVTAYLKARYGIA